MRSSSGGISTAGAAWLELLSSSRMLYSPESVSVSSASSTIDSESVSSTSSTIASDSVSSTFSTIASASVFVSESVSSNDDESETCGWLGNDCL